MAVFRVERIKDYTVMSNHHLRNKNLSLKAKGLLSQMLSLPDDWDYTLKGLAAINKESVDAIRTAIWELEDTGYVVRTRVRDERGCLRGCDYYVYEYPQASSSGSDGSAESVPPMLEPLASDSAVQENPIQLNKEIQNKEKQNTDVLTSFPSFWREDRSTQKDRMERRKIYSEQIRENISYDYLSNYTNADRERLDELVSLMLDTVCSTKSSIRVAGEELPAEVVRSRLLKLTGAHLLYVLDRINENTTEVRHVKPYLLTALYNAPLTMDNHYALMVGHDLSGGSG